MTSADSRIWTFFARVSTLSGPPGVIHDSFTVQPLDLLSWFYVYPSGFSLFCNLAHHLALYPVSVRRLTVLLCTSSPISITVYGLCSATLGGKYLRLDFHQQESCHARHTPQKAHPWFLSEMCFFIGSNIRGQLSHFFISIYNQFSISSIGCLYGAGSGPQYNP